MASVNKAIIVGSLGKDPETRYTPNGDQITNISIATTDTWKDKATGEKREATEWHRVVFFGKLAEIVGTYGKKGGQVYIEGRLRTRKWQDKDGQDRYTTEINGDVFQMLGKREDSQQGDSRNSKSQSPASGGFTDFSDDVPFSPIGRGLSFHSI